MKDMLTKAYADFQVNHTFQAGDIVNWKPNMKHKKTDGPLIVMEVLPEPLFDTSNNGGSPYFREPLDIILGCYDKDGDFLTYYFDSRRFQPYEG